MAINTLIIPTRLESLNDMIHAMNSNKYAGANIKNRAQRKIQSITTMTCETLPEDGWWYFEWHEFNKRRDPDNVASARKYIFDAFQEMHLIENDNWKYVKGFHDEFFDDATEETAYIKIVHCTTREEYLATIMGLVTES